MKKYYSNRFYPENQCEEHGIVSNLPCPWPLCPNGFEDEEFEQASPIDGKKPDIYTRHKWNYPNGDSYYTWESNKEPSWFSIQQTFWNEVKRNNLIEPINETVYHYTSLEGFMGIVQSKSLWMTDYSYLNDTKEIVYGIDTALELMDNIRISDHFPRAGELIPKWKENLLDDDNRVVIASFSGNSDSLNQWLSYGTVAIGFEVRDLALHVDQSRLRPIVYDKEKQKQMMEMYLFHTCQAYQLDLKKKGNKRWKKIMNDTYYKIDRLFDLISFFKNPAFKFEEEYRLIHIEDKKIYEDFGLQIAPKHFRSANGKIIPYTISTEILTNPDRNYPFVIKEIILAPGSDSLLEHGVRDFLDSNGLTSVAIHRSKTPFRP